MVSLFFLFNLFLLSFAQSSYSYVNGLPGCNQAIFELTYFLKGIFIPWILADFFCLACMILWRPTTSGKLCFKQFLMFFALLPFAPLFLLLPIICCFYNCCTKKSLKTQIFGFPQINKNRVLILPNFGQPQFNQPQQPNSLPIMNDFPQNIPNQYFPNNVGVPNLYYGQGTIMANGMTNMNYCQGTNLPGNLNQSQPMNNTMNYPPSQEMEHP